jgi:hypothetical protein
MVSPAGVDTTCVNDAGALQYTVDAEAIDPLARVLNQVVSMCLFVAWDSERKHSKGLEVRTVTVLGAHLSASVALLVAAVSTAWCPLLADVMPRCCVVCAVCTETQQRRSLAALWLRSQR